MNDSLRFLPLYPKPWHAALRMQLLKCRVYGFWCSPLIFSHIFIYFSSSWFEAFIAGLAKVSNVRRIQNKEGKKKRKSTYILTTFTVSVIWLSLHLWQCFQPPGHTSMRTSVRQVKYGLICYMWNINLPQRSAPHVWETSQVVLICTCFLCVCAREWH